MDQILTKYEKAKILGIRSIQIANGAKPNIEVPKNIIDSMEIAKLEFNSGKIPFMIRRKMPDQTYIDIKLTELVDLS